MKKLLSLLLAALLLLSLAASAEGGDPYGKYDELVTISYLGTDNSATTYDSSVEGRRSPYDNVWIDAYEKYLNIKIERTVAEDNTALSALVTTQLASGDLPDIMLVPKALFYTLAENDVLADLEDVYEENAGRLVMSAVDSFPDAIDVGYYNGKMLGFPLIQNVHNVNQKVLWVRTDWLDALGLSIPTTMDELYDVATAFKEAQFGGENTYGIAISDIEEGIMSGFGAVIGTWTEKDGKYVYANTTEECKRALSTCRTCTPTACCAAISPFPSPYPKTSPTAWSALPTATPPGACFRFRPVTTTIPTPSGRPCASPVKTASPARS